ncbi:protein of unknown function DUF1028 [Halomonas sp. KO116]|nr:DUF1028 domain-containing protein [Halomonas sp. KO116]AJY49148.1 protein of unknown function DUF1028 [Halomonas sp. KO116]
MTLSLVHCHPATGTVATITATGGVAVGGYVHHCWRGVGACVTQGRFTNPWYPAQVHGALVDGATAKQALGAAISQDSDAALRQCLVMDAHGRSSVHSGSENIAKVEDVRFPGVAAVGNMLQSSDVVQILAEHFLSLSATNSGAAIKRSEAPAIRIITTSTCWRISLTPLMPRWTRVAISVAPAQPHCVSSRSSKPPLICALTGRKTSWLP